MAENVVEIVVKSKNDTREGFASAKRDAAVAGDEAGRAYSSSLSARLTRSLFGGMFGGGGGAGGGGLLGLFGGGAGGAAAAGGLGAGGIAAGAIVGAAVAPAAAGLFATLTAGLFGVQAGLKQNTAAGKEFSAALATIQKAAGQAFGPVVGEMAKFAKSIAPALGQLVASAAPGFLSFFKALEPAIKQTIPLLSSFIKSFAPFAGTLGHAVGNALLDIVKALRNLQPAFRASAQFISVFVDVAGGLLDMLARTVGALVRIVYDLMTGKWRDAWRAGDDLLRYAFDGFRSVMLKFLIFVSTRWVPDVLSFIGRGLAKLPSMMLDIGRNAISSFLSGLKSMPVVGTVETIFGGAISAAKHILGIGSPSRVMREIGRNATEGFRLGLQDNAANLHMGGAITGGRGGGGGGPIQIELYATGTLGTLIEALKGEIRVRGGGGTNSVQVALGQRH